MRASSKRSKDRRHKHISTFPAHHISLPSIYTHTAKPRAAAIIPPAGTTNPKSAAALLVDAGPAAPVAVATMLPAPPVVAGAVIVAVIVAIDPTLSNPV
jgi:hypothetical protein